MFGITTASRLDAAQQKILTLHAELGVLQDRLAQEQRAHRTTAQARRSTASALYDEIDAHLTTIRALRETEGALAAERRANRTLEEQALTTAVPKPVQRGGEGARR